MLKKIIFILFFSIFNTKNILTETPLCISLGGTCGPALNLRDLKIRTEAYPFDWLVSPFESLYRALTDDFELFLINIQVAPHKNGVIDHYGFHFTHDWPTILDHDFDPLTTDFIGCSTLYPEWEMALPSVRKKYQRRIKRFKKTCF